MSVCKNTVWMTETISGVSVCCVCMFCVSAQSHERERMIVFQAAVPLPVP